MNQKQTDITTGKQIRHLRTQSGMTQEELAGELNVTRQALSNWERDVNEPDLNTLKKICFHFWRPHGRFCEGDNNKNGNM